MYANIMSSLTGVSPPGMSLKFNAIGGWFCGSVSVIVAVVVAHESPEFWSFALA